MSKEKYSERSFYQGVAFKFSECAQYQAQGDVYLDGSTRENYTTLHVEGIQSLECERLCRCAWALSTKGKCEAV